MAGEQVVFSYEFLKSVYPELYQKSQVIESLSSEDWDAISAAPMDLFLLPDTPMTIEEQIRVIFSLPQSPVPNKSNYPVVVILAGGKGSRMGCGHNQKVLCPICGSPALLRAIKMYQSFGISEFVVVVGVGYKKVVECLQKENLNVTFLFQEEQLGTGHAGRLAARYLEYQNYKGDVLVVMGDKYVTRRALEQLFNDHERTRADLTLTAANKNAWPDAGRVVLDKSNQVRAIIEKPDIVLKRLLHDLLTWEEDPIPSHAFLSRAKQYWNRPGKLKKILGEEFWGKLHKQPFISKNSRFVDNPANDPLFHITDSLVLLGKEVEDQCELVNLSVYLFKSAALYESMDNLKADNAQGELYLTDAALFLSSHLNKHPFKVIASTMPDDNDVMGFNTREELEKIEAHVQKLGFL